jgi:uncharacterized paraquat-inducible protein A
MKKVALVKPTLKKRAAKKPAPEKLPVVVKIKPIENCVRCGLYLRADPLPGGNKTHCGFCAQAMRDGRAASLESRHVAASVAP